MRIQTKVYANRPAGCFVLWCQSIFPGWFRETLSVQACFQHRKAEHLSPRLPKATKLRTSKYHLCFCESMVFAIHSLRMPCFRSSNCQEFHSKIDAKTWKPAQTKHQENLKWDPKITPELLKHELPQTESTIVLAMLQSTGKFQVVFSHKRGTENAS